MKLTVFSVILALSLTNINVFCSEATEEQAKKEQEAWEGAEEALRLGNVGHIFILTSTDKNPGSWEIPFDNGHLSISSQRCLLLDKHKGTFKRSAKECEKHLERIIELAAAQQREIQQAAAKELFSKKYK